MKNRPVRMAELGQEMQSILQKGRKLNPEYTATESDFKPIIVAFLKKQKKTQQQVMQLHFQLREKINEEEWEIIFAKTVDSPS